MYKYLNTTCRLFNKTDCLLYKVWTVNRTWTTKPFHQNFSKEEKIIILFTFNSFITITKSSVIVVHPQQKRVCIQLSLFLIFTSNSCTSLENSILYVYISYCLSLYTFYIQVSSISYSFLQQVLQCNLFVSCQYAMWI